MMKYLQSFFALFLLGFMFSCNEQKKDDQSTVVTSQTNQPAAISPEIDPYFIDSKTINSSYGPKSINSSYGPMSITRNIIQDKKGNFWFATWEGIMQFDGNSFTNFTNKAGLKRFRVFTILEDKAGNIWFGTVGAGVYLYDGKTFTNFTTKEGLVNNRIGCILEAKNGDIWIGTAGGISKYDGNSFTNLTTKEGLTNNDVNTIIEDKTGKLWIGTRGDACFYNGTIFTKITNSAGQSFANVRSIIKDKEGNIWLGGNDGLWAYDGSSFTNFTKNFVGDVYQDKEENIWTTSAVNGNSNKWSLSRYDTMSLKSKKATATQIKTEEGMLFGILEDSEGHIWVGSLNGVYRYDGHSFNDFKDATRK